MKSGGLLCPPITIARTAERNRRGDHSSAANSFGSSGAVVARRYIAFIVAARPIAGVPTANHKAIISPGSATTRTRSGVCIEKLNRNELRIHILQTELSDCR